MNITRIYLVENCFGDPNKVYIGKTKTSRKSAHKCKFGDKITYSYIDEISSLNKKDWEPLETFWIQQFKVWGFEVLNKNEGGGGVEIHSEETKLKLSKILTGKTRSEETKNKLRHSLKGLKHVSDKMKGLKRSNETKLKMSLAKIGTKLPQSTKQKMSNVRLGKKQPNISKARTGLKQPESFFEKKNKPISQYHKDGTLIQNFKSITEAAQYLGFSKDPGGISCVLNGRQKTAYGFIWKYKI
jgi:group I intron endonuclease